jgi:26S proteasome regulatory subunit (ATPase 3-interacting protein)
MEKEEESITGRLDALKKGKAKKVTAEERVRIEREWKMWGSVARKREKIAGAMWREIEGAIEDREKKEELREMFDLDG